MPDVTDTMLARLKAVRAASVKAGFSPTDFVGIAGSVIATFVRKAEKGNVFEVIATTDDIDLDEEVVIPAGANLDYFRRNGSVFVDHDTRTESRVGVARGIRPWPTGSQQRGWVVDVSMDTGDAALGVIAKCEAGGMGMSIGFRTRERGSPTPDEMDRYTKDGRVPRSIVRQWDWLELSFTAMPCNVACRVIAMPERAPAKAVRQIVWQDGKAFTRTVLAKA